MADLSEFVSNPELVTSVLGSWPSFHDAEVLSVELRRDPEVTVTLTIKAFPYNPSGKPQRSLFTLLFKGVEKPSLEGFNEQNSLWDLTVEREGGRLKLTLPDSYGLAGEFWFREAEVLHVERVE